MNEIINFKEDDFYLVGKLNYQDWGIIKKDNIIDDYEEFLIQNRNPPYKFTELNFEEEGKFIDYFNNTLIFKNVDGDHMYCIFDHLLIIAKYIQSILNLVKNVTRIKIIRSFEHYKFITLPYQIENQLIEKFFVYDTTFLNNQKFQYSIHKCKEGVKDENGKYIMKIGFHESQNFESYVPPYKRFKCNRTIGKFKIGDYVIQPKGDQNSIILSPIKHFSNIGLCKNEDSYFWKGLFQLFSMDPHIESICLNFGSFEKNQTRNYISLFETHGYIYINFIQDSYPSCFFPKQNFKPNLKRKDHFMYERRNLNIETILERRYQRSIQKNIHLKEPEEINVTESIQGLNERFIESNERFIESIQGLNERFISNERIIESNEGLQISNEERNSFIIINIFQLVLSFFRSFLTKFFNKL